MLRFLADENLNNQIVRGVLRRNSNIDIVRVQDVGLTEIDDATVLQWAAQNVRVVLTHDVATMTNFAYELSLLPNLKFYGLQSSIVCSDRKSHYHHSSTTNYFCPIHGHGIIPP